MTKATFDVYVETADRSAPGLRNLIITELHFRVFVYSRSSGHPHAAHSVAEAMRPEGGHIILLDLHLVALEVRELIQADLVLHAVL